MYRQEIMIIGNTTVPCEGLVFAEGQEILETVKNKLDRYVHLNPIPQATNGENVLMFGVNASIQPFKIPDVDDPYGYIVNLVEALKSCLHVDDSSGFILKKVLYTILASGSEPNIELVREMVEEEANYLTGVEYVSIRRLESILTDMMVGSFGSAMREDKLTMERRNLVTIPPDFPLLFRQVPLAILLLRLMYERDDDPILISEVEAFVPSRSNVLREERAVMFERVSGFMRMFKILSMKRKLVLLESSSASLVAPETLVNSDLIMLRRPRIDAEVRLLEAFKVPWENLASDDVIVFNPRDNIMVKRFKVQPRKVSLIQVKREIPISKYSPEPVLKRLFPDEWRDILDILKFVRDSQPVRLEALETFAEEKKGDSKILRTLISLGMLQTSRSLRGVNAILTRRGEDAIKEVDAERERG